MRKKIFPFQQLIIVCVALATALTCNAWERKAIWPKGKMPHPQSGQVAAMTDETEKPGFDSTRHRTPYLEWFDAPAKENRTGTCMILISGGSYVDCCDVELIEEWREKLTPLGVQCVNFVYRTPRPAGLPIYQSAWEDGQRAVRMVRAQAKKRGFYPERIGIVCMSAGSHLGLLLAGNSQTPAYQPVDSYDTIPCHINLAVVLSPAYVTTDAESGTPAERQGFGTDVSMSALFKFDSFTCPLSLHHGGIDIYSPNGSSLVYNKLHTMGIPAELHIYPGLDHGAYGFDHGIEFMRQMGFLGKISPAEPIVPTQFVDADLRIKKEQLWPAGATPNAIEFQPEPAIEWFVPSRLMANGVQIICAVRDYGAATAANPEMDAVRRYLNSKGIAVVKLTPRTSQLSGLAVHTTSWQDLQRAIRLVRSEASSYGLSPDKIGVMGIGAGAHLALLGAVSSLHQSYLPIDDIDRLPCSVKWGVCISPSGVLAEGNSHHGNQHQESPIAPEFVFDLKTAPTLFLHGESDPQSSLGPVKVWEKMRAIGVQSELHTAVLPDGSFHVVGSPATGSYTWVEKIYDYVRQQMK